jgi:hypothetical protein
MAVRLGLAKADRWLDLGHGVRVLVRPLTTAVYQAARQTGQRLATAYALEQGLIAEAGGTITDAPDAADRDALEGLQGLYFIQALALHAIQEWKGVENADGTAALATRADIKALMAEQPSIAESFLVLYTRPIAEAITEGEG